MAGRVAVERAGADSADTPLPGGQVRLAFAVLVLERDRTVSRHDLADHLWPDRLPATWEAAVRNVVTRLRQALAATALGSDEVIVSNVEGYRANLPGDTTVDLEDAEAEVVEAERLVALGQPAVAATRLARAAATLAAPVLPGVEGPWADRVRDDCPPLRVPALEQLAPAALLDEQSSEAVQAASAAVAVAPFRESAHRLLMRAHVANGNRAEALRAYSRCRQQLIDELGVGPAPETEHDYLELLLADEHSDGGGQPSTSTDREGDTAAVSPRIELLGREAELVELGFATSSSQVVTVCGPGGVGKTHLVRTFGDAASGRFDGGARWVELVSVDASGVSAAIANAVSGEAIGIDPVDAVVRACRDGTTLLVLDSCEHVVDEVACIVGTLLRSSRTARVLATSRVPLGVGGERVIRLAPLALPVDPDDVNAIDESPAITLFTRRAAEARSDFELDPSTTPSVVEICRRLDGMPLAIELAASLVRLMPVADIAQRLDDRFRLLRTSRRDVDARHQSLADVIRWSYELLRPIERDMFDRLAVFPGSFSLGGAHRVAGVGGDELDTLELLTHLVDHSMVVAVGDDEARFTLLESVREYGRGNLSSGPAWRETRQRFVDDEIAFAETAAAGVRGPDEALWIKRIDAELANLTAAFRWMADEGDVDRCLRLVVSLFDYAFHRIRHEVGVLAEEAVRLPHADRHPRFSEAAATAGYLAWQRGLVREADEHLAIALRAGESWHVRDALGTVAVFRGDVDAAIAEYALASELAGDAYLQAITHSQRAFASVYAGRSDAAQLAALSEAAAAESNNPTALAQAAWATGLVLLDSDPAFALLRLERCIELSTPVRNRLARGAASVPVQELRTRLERRSSVDDVRRALQEISFMHGTGNTATQGVVLRRLVWGLADLGLAEDAVVLAGAEARASLNLPMRPRERQRHESVLAALRERLGQIGFDRLLARGGALSSDELVSLLRAVSDALPADPPD
jgi:predicted ATPase/DNA-binding SARP family transcriptional activator